MAPVAPLAKLAKIKVGPVRYNSPMTQVCICGFVVFCTVGMFSALTNIGAGGSQSVSLVDLTNSILYAFFAVVGLIAGGINNILGPRLTIFFGCFGYALYVGGLWCHQTTGNEGFLVASGAILGICAALLWAAQGAIMMAYPLEKDKGKSFGIFWAIFQMGAVVGAAITLGLSIHSVLPGVATSTYIAFLIIICIGLVSTQLLLPPNYVIRSDDTIVKVEAKSDLRNELKGIFATLKDWRMIVLLPMFFASNWFYAYQSSVNAHYFNGRTRALNALLEGFGAIFGALFIGNICLDSLWLGGRKRRGYIGLGVVTALVIGVWVPALVWQTSWNRADAPTVVGNKEGVDFLDAEYPKRGVLYFFFYFADATYQALAYWIMAALTNDPWTLARYAGLYKAVQSAGAVGSFAMDAVNTPLLNEHLSSFLMMVVSLPLSAVVISTIKETNYDQEKTVHVEELDYVPGLTAHPDDLEKARKSHEEGAASPAGAQQESLDDEK